MNTEKDSIQLSIIDISSNLVYVIDDYLTKYEILWKVSKNNCDKIYKIWLFA